jgi:hypothetical protein
VALKPELTPPRLRSSLPAVDIGGFFKAVDEALNLHLGSSKWPEGTKPVLVHSFPKERITKPDDPFDVITFSVGGSEMAATSNDGSRIPRGPTLRDKVVSKTKYGYDNVTVAWKEEVAVIFNIWSRSNRRADDMVNWFHRFMMKYGAVYKFFMARGVDRFQFVRRGRDEVENVEGQEIYKRSLVYMIRIEYVDVLEEKLLETVTLNVGVVLPTDTIELP